MRELITVDMSEMQFAQFITSMNTHSGASCTLGRVGGRRREAPPRDMLGKETFQGDVEARAKKVGAGLRGAIGLVEGLAERGRAGKGDLTEVANALRAAAMEIESNMPHLMERMAENVERLLETARADLNAHAHLLRQVATKDEGWMSAYRLWVKVFALSFAMGVVSGITMSFQFGTNWPGFMERVGNIAGPLLAYEILTAFFLEATFLGVMLFGHGRVPDRLHTAATALVAFGTTMSAFWILVLNSWMHTPAGYELRDGVAFATDWWAIVFNPSMPYRLVHVLLASGLTVAFLVAGISAWRWLRGDRSGGVDKGLRAGLAMAAVLIPLQILAGDLHGLNTKEHQPAKVAAMEGIWETERGAGLRLFAIPDEATRSNRFEVTIPYAASLILTHSWDGEVRGLNEFKGEHPPVAPVFWGFRVMVGVGLLMLLVGWWGAWQVWRRGAMNRPLAWALVAMTFSGWVATLAGWYTTEIGRQPWLVTGILRTGEAAGPVSAAAIGFSLAMYLLVYAFLLAAYVATLYHLAARPDKATPEAGPDKATPEAGAEMKPMLPGRPPPAPAPASGA